MSTEPPKLLDQVRNAIRARHYSRRTEEAYAHWIKRYILFHGKRHPREMGASHVAAFLTSLAVHDRVSASTQNQALSGVLFLYREVLRQDPGVITNVPRARTPHHSAAWCSRTHWRGNSFQRRLSGGGSLCFRPDAFVVTNDLDHLLVFMSTNR